MTTAATTRPGKVYPHGDDRRYIWNRCRCDDCRAAHTAEAARRRRLIAYGQWDGYIDSTGTVRRLRALSTIGWSVQHVAQRFEQRDDVDPSWLRAIARGEQRKVHGATARTIATIYDDWCTEDGPSKHSRSWAVKKRWHGPEAWTDDTIDDPHAEPLTGPVICEVAVARAVAGHAAYGDLNRAEQVETYRRLRNAGHGDGTIRKRLRINGYTLARLAAAAAAEAEVAA